MSSDVVVQQRLTMLCMSNAVAWSVYLKLYIMLLYILYANFITITNNLPPFIMINRFRLNDMVFAKCQNYPYWPGKIIAVITHNASYKVLFYGEKSEATIDESSILPFNEETHRKMSLEGSYRTNKALRYSITIAYKRYNKRRNGLNSSSED